MIINHGKDGIVRKLILLSGVATCLMALAFGIGVLFGIEMSHRRAEFEISSLARVEARLSVLPTSVRWQDENVKEAISTESLAFMGWGEGWLSTYSQPGTNWCYKLVQTQDGILLTKYPEGIGIQNGAGARSK